jgi:adenylate cyclase
MEIERKYLVNEEVWLALDKPAGERIIQGYISTANNKTVRVRLKGASGYMTVKGKTIGISREEIEFPIPVDKATELMEKFAEGIIEKIRYTIPYHGKMWEVDEFLGENMGLLLAEIELNSEEEQFEVPGWIGVEVSHDVRYFNSHLSKRPFKTW